MSPTTEKDNLNGAFGFLNLLICPFSLNALVAVFCHRILFEYYKHNLYHIFNSIMFKKLLNSPKFGKFCHLTQNKNKQNSAALEHGSQKQNKNDGLGHRNNKA